jgi:hypothetical protein
MPTHNTYSASQRERSSWVRDVIVGASDGSHVCHYCVETGAAFSTWLPCRERGDGFDSVMEALEPEGAARQGAPAMKYMLLIYENPGTREAHARRSSPTAG